jgi:hypothetical protein
MSITSITTIPPMPDPASQQHVNQSRTRWLWLRKQARWPRFSPSEFRLARPREVERHGGAGEPEQGRHDYRR